MKTIDVILLSACILIAVAGIIGLILINSYDSYAEPKQAYPLKIDVNIDQESITGSSVVVKEKARIVEEEHKPIPPKEIDPALIIESQGEYNDIYLKNGLSSLIYVLKGCNYPDDLKIYDSEGELVYPETGFDCLIIPSYIEVEPGEKFFLAKWTSDSDCCEETLGIECSSCINTKEYTVEFTYYLASDGKDPRMITKKFFEVDI